MVADCTLRMTLDSDVYDFFARFYISVLRGRWPAVLRPPHCSVCFYIFCGTGMPVPQEALARGPRVFSGKVLGVLLFSLLNV